MYVLCVVCVLCLLLIEFVLLRTCYCVCWLLLCLSVRCDLFVWLCVFCCVLLVMGICVRVLGVLKVVVMLFVVVCVVVWIRVGLFALFASCLYCVYVLSVPMCVYGLFVCV